MLFRSLAHQLPIEVHLAATPLGGLDLHEVPVHGAAVGVVTILIGVARREVDRTGDLLIKEGVVHGVVDRRVDPEGELADVACPLIEIEDRIDLLIIINQSAPHGAGRVMSRTQARKRIPLPEYQRMMQNVYSTSVSKQTLDEAPSAYNPQNKILKLAAPTIEVMEYLRPIYNLKA